MKTNGAHASTAATGGCRRRTTSRTTNTVPTTSSAAATGPYHERAASDPTWSCHDASARAMSSRPRTSQNLNQPWSAPRPSSMRASGSTITAAAPIATSTVSRTRPRAKPTTSPIARTAIATPPYRVKTPMSRDPEKSTNENR